MSTAHHGHSYEPIGIELEQIQRSRLPSFASSGNNHTGPDEDDASHPLINEDLRPALDVHIERGFDVPLITGTHNPKTPDWGSRRSPQVCTEDTQALTDDDLQHGAKKTKAADAAVLEYLPPDNSMRQRRSWRKGWRAGVVASAGMTTSVLLVNIILTIWACARYDLNGGIGDVYAGDCGVVNAWSTGLHVLINGLSSAMFSASNYTMQCLTAPTRKDCDVAHAQGDWVDVGVPSVRNLSRIHWHRRLAWGMLGLTSIPIHFLYNSAVFKQLDNNIDTHNKVLVSPEFLETANINFTGFANVSRDSAFYSYESNRMEQLYMTPVASQLHAAYLSNSSQFDRLDSTECSQMYSQDILSGHSHLLMVLDAALDYENMPAKERNQASALTRFPNGTLTGTYYNTTRPFFKLWPNWTEIGVSGDTKNIPYYWPCESCSLGATGKFNTSTSPGGDYDYCLAKRVEPQCKLQFSLQILVVVILCNCAKAFVMFWTLWCNHDETFVTFGDAIASWLDKPDDSTKGECLISRRDVTSGRLRRNYSRPEGLQPSARFSTAVQRWGVAVSIKRWAVTITLCSIAIGVALFLLFDAARNFYESDVNEAITDGRFGAVDPNLVLDSIVLPGGASGLLLAVLIVNSPQLILSFCYLLYNGLFTCMHLAHEYSGYAKTRKSLRVTTARGGQRSTYWLQLPYTYGVPLIVASAVLHWLISQAIFLARIVGVVDEDGDGGVHYREHGYSDAGSEIGISIPPIHVSIVLASCMLITVVGMGFRKLESNIPVAASCSFALAAASHRPKDDVDASVLPVLWGEIPDMGNEEVGHCCFTSQEVVEPVSGRKYAGAQNDGRGQTTGIDA